MSESPTTARTRLRGEAYGTAGPLSARAALYRYQDEPLDLQAWVLDLAAKERPLDAPSRVLDVGCGPGWYLAKVRDRHPGIAAIGFDLSAGMARTASAAGGSTAVADAMQLPARADAFDLVICAHMLYHVPDIGLAARELARVVTPDGVVAIVTNGAHHLDELDELLSDVLRSVAGEARAPRTSDRFSLDAAADLVAPALRVVRDERVRRAITVPETATLVAYVDSQHSLFPTAVRARMAWPDVLAEVEARAATVIERDGAFVVHGDVGVLLCRPAP